MSYQIVQSCDVVETARQRATPRLLAQVERRSSLESRTIRQMFDLYSTYYESTSPSLFEADLGDKDCVVILRDEGGALVGFSSLANVDATVEGRRVRAIYREFVILERLSPHTHKSKAELIRTIVEEFLRNNPNRFRRKTTRAIKRETNILISDESKSPAGKPREIAK